MGRDERLELVVERLGLDLGDASPLESDSNDAWRVGDAVLRVCWRGDPERLHREALVLAELPDEVPHPALIDAGWVGDLSWTLTRWIDAPVLRDVWASLPPRDRLAATDQLAQALAALHAWEPGGDTAGAVRHRAPQPDPASIVGADLNPLPVDRASQLLPAVRDAAPVDREVLDALAARFEELRPIDPLAEPGRTVIHGDAHLGNALWDGSRIAAVIDLEWARPGPPDLELQPLLRPEDGHRSEIIGRLGATYPGLVDHPDLVDRLWLYDLAFTLRHLVVWPATAPPSELPAFHPVNRLPRIVRSPAYIEQVLGG